MAKPNKLASANRELYLKANGGDRQNWEKKAQESYDFYLNDQLSDKERTQLQEAGMPDFTVNRITPVVEMMLYFCTDKSPKWQAVGIEGSDSDLAHMHSTIAEYCWHNSKGQSLYSQVIRDSIVKGVGYMQIDVDPNADRGRGEVVFKRLEPFDVYVDPMSSDFLYRDAGFIIVKKNISKTTLKSMLPNFTRKVQSAQSFEPSGTTGYSMRDLSDTDSIQHTDINHTYKPDGEQDELLDYYERYSKKQIQFVNCLIKQLPHPDELEEMKKRAALEAEVALTELQVELSETAKMLAQQVTEGGMMQERADVEFRKKELEVESAMDELKATTQAQAQELNSRTVNQIVTKVEFDKLSENKTFQDSLVDYSTFWESRIEMNVSVGDKHLYTMLLNTQEYPIVPFPYLHTGTPFPMSCVTPLIGKQKEINKAHQIMLHNANLASNLRWMYQEGSIPEDEWENYSASPGALLKVRQGFEMPVPVQPLPLNQAFHTTANQGKQDIEYLSGIYSSMQGDTSSQPETYRGLLATDEHGTRRIKSYIANMIEPALEQLGLVFKDYSQDVYRGNKVFRIVQPNASGDLEQAKVEVNIPTYNDFGKQIGKFNDYASARFDIKIVAGSTLPVNRWALVEEYFRWFQAGLIDDVAMLNETDVRNKDKVLERKGIMNQQAQRIETQDEEISDLNDMVESLKNQLVTAGVKDKVREANVQNEISGMETKYTQKLAQQLIKKEAQQQAAKLGEETSRTIDSIRSLENDTVVPRK